MAKAATPKSDTVKSVISLKVTLQRLAPPIWRRILVPGSITLGDLSDVLLATMGWHGGHLHDFTVAGRDYGDPAMLDDVGDEDRLTLNGVIAKRVKRFTYTYDMGDNWEHLIAIETSQPAHPEGTYPLCIAGKRNCPPEDCGGIWGYTELLEILADPAHPEREERLEWLDEDELDPEAFNIDAINQHLALVAKRIRN
jgi:Plasmid pRiA4b ORF-3-like protein